MPATHFVSIFLVDFNVIFQIYQSLAHHAQQQFRMVSTYTIHDKLLIKSKAQPSRRLKLDYHKSYNYFTYFKFASLAYKNKYLLDISFISTIHVSHRNHIVSLKNLLLSRLKFERITVTVEQRKKVTAVTFFCCPTVTM